MSKAVEQASWSDAAWFKRHRDRAYRLRPGVAGEFPEASYPPGAARLALVKQTLPGIRLRLAIWTTRPVCDCEDCLAAAWDRMAPPTFRALAVEVAAICLRGAR